MTANGLFQGKFRVPRDGSVFHLAVRFFESRAWEMGENVDLLIDSS